MTAQHVPLVPGGMHELFDEVVHDVIVRQGFDASATCERYLVDLLVDFGRPGVATEAITKPFGVAFLEAAQGTGPAKMDKLRLLGDSVLYHSSFFSEHLEQRGVPLRFVKGLGAAAYDQASFLLCGLSVEGRRNDVFGELAAKFESLVNLLKQVSDTLYSNGVKSCEDTVALYRRWIETSSPALADALFRHGWRQLDGGGKN